MDAPTTFTRQLKDEFQDRLRIRWSAKRREFHIEQRVGRMAPNPCRIDEGDDDLIRARDGYIHVMSISPGDRTPCPECHFELQVPVMDTADIRCPYCQIKGRTTRVVAGYWPLNERLIDHLRKLDPLRGHSHELAAEADRRNVARLKAAEANLSDTVISAADDDYRRLVGIPSVGYTGKEFR